MHDINKTILSQNMKRLMKEHNLTQDMLAKEFCLEQSTISKYINCKQLPPLTFLYSFAKRFNISMDYLCEAATSTTESQPPQNDSYPSPNEYILGTCSALATLFKASALRTELLEKREVTYEEIIDDGFETGMYSRAKDYINSDPVHKYISIYFSNYFEVETAFASADEAEDYYSDLQQTGNYHEQNAIVNTFLKKLTDLHDIYMQDSLNRESYLHSIDSNLKALKAELTHK